MSALKNLLKSDTPTSESTQPSGNSGKISGQGSHFPSRGGEGLPTESTAGISQTPQHSTSGDGSGQAAIGETTTYSKSTLPAGNPTGSVVDHESSNPLTYVKPETSAGTGNAGVTSGAAAAAATTAFQKSGEQMPGGYPTAGYENPYKTTHLDPRVDGGKAGTETEAAGTGSGVGTGTTATSVAGIGATKAYESSHQPSTQSTAIPSTLTTTTDPTDRSAEYQSTTSTKGLEGETQGEQQGVVGKVLGALGLGGAAGAAAAAVGYGSKKEDNETAVDSTPVTSTQEQGPPKHYRRESIPTTAYPHGRLDAVKAIPPPVGGAQTPVTHAEEDTNRGAGTGTVAAATGGVVTTAAGGAIAAREHEKTQTLRENTTGYTQGPIPDSTGTGTSAGTTTSTHFATTSPQDSHVGRDVAAGGTAVAGAGAAGYAVHEHNRPHEPTTTTLHSNTATSTGPPIDAVAAAPGRYEGQDVPPPTTTTGTTSTLTERPKEEDHTARNTALGAGAGATVVGGAAYAKHEHDEKAAEEQRAHQKDVERQAKEHQKDIEKQEKEHEKELEKQQKEHQKELERQEKERQKEIEKQEKEQKKHEKEAEKEAEKEQKKAEKEHKKEEKAAAAAAEAEEERRRRESARAAWEQEKARTEAEEEERKRRAAEVGAGVGVAGAAGAGATAYEHNKHEKADDAALGQKEKEKKPNIFKRIFKRRKNKDTGEDEDYSTDEEDASGSNIPHHHSNNKGRNVLGSGSQTTETGRHTDSTTGLAYDPAKDPAAAQRLSHDPNAPQGPRGTDAAPMGGTAEHGAGISERKSSVTGVYGGESDRPVDQITGLPYDPRHDPEAARRLSRDPGADLSHRGTDNAPPGGEVAPEGTGYQKETGGEHKSFLSSLKENLTGGKPSADHSDQHTRQGL